MSSAADTLSQAVQYHQTGDLRKAELSYRKVLQTDPANADAWHLLGLLAHQLDQNDSAIDSMKQALRLNPDFPEAHNSLGMALKSCGQFEQAMASWQQAVRLRPDFAEAHNNLGMAFGDQGMLDAAVASYRQAVASQPDFADAHNNLAVALHSLGQHDDALANWHQAIRARPGHMESHFNLGTAFYHLDRLPEAIASLQQAVRLRPSHAQAHNQLGNALRDNGQLPQAIASYQKAVIISPDFVNAHNNLALAWLLVGDWEQGWPEHEWRLQTKGFSLPNLQQPRWDGASLSGRTILLQTEQGFGDTLQFIRYAQLLKQQGGTVVVSCQPALVRLLSSCPGIDLLIANGDPLPEFDVQAPLMSLPSILGTSLEAIPTRIPYVFADFKLVEQWRRRFQELRLFKIGIAWQGNPNYRRDRQRSIPLLHFSPLANLAGIQLVSLQRGLGTEQIHALAEQVPVTILSGNLDEAAGPFMDTAAVMKNLDLVITSDSAVAHLAGALGVPVWLALPFAPDWRWLMQREDSPWYPSMRLFRQPEPGNWQAVFNRIAAELNDRAPRPPVRDSGEY